MEMDNLLDDIDSLVPPGLSTETPDWCVNCQSLRQEVKTLKEEHGQNFSRLKQKIINTDLLIKKFKAKCDDYDLQCKKTEEAVKRADKFQRQCEILETQLKAALLDTEPLRKTKVSLEEELKVKKCENQTMSDKLLATEGMQRQFEHLAKTNIANVEKLEAEKKELTKKIKSLELGKVSKEIVKELKNEISTLKKENSSLKKDITSVKNKEEKLELKLQIANNNIEELNMTLKEKGMSPRGRRRTSPVKSPFHSPKLGRYKSPLKSPAVNKRKQTYSATQSLTDGQIAPCEERLGSSDVSFIDDSDDDNNSTYSIGWTFSPLKPCISPLPPSPACFTHQNDTDDDCSDIADDLEQLLGDDLEKMDDLENIGDLGNTGDLENSGDFGNTGNLGSTTKSSNTSQMEENKVIDSVEDNENIEENMKDVSTESYDKIDDRMEMDDNPGNNICDNDDNKLINYSAVQNNAIDKDNTDIAESEHISGEIDYSKKEDPDVINDSEYEISTLDKDFEKVDLSVDKGSEKVDSTVDNGSEKVVPIVNKGSEKGVPIANKGSEKVDPIVDKGSEKEIPIVNKGSKKVDLIVNKGSEKVDPIVDKDSEKVDPIVDKGSEKVDSIVDKDSEKVVHFVDKESEKVVPSVGQGSVKGNSKTYVEENIAGAKDLMSPKLLKSTSSHVKTMVESENDTDAIKTVSKTPAIRRSARIRSKRDSEASEVESDCNNDITCKNKGVDLKPNVSEIHVIDRIDSIETKIDKSLGKVDSTKNKETEVELIINLNESPNCDNNEVAVNEKNSAEFKSETIAMKHDGASTVCNPESSKTGSETINEQKFTHDFDKFVKKQSDEDRTYKDNISENEDKILANVSYDTMNEKPSSNSNSVYLEQDVSESVDMLEEEDKNEDTNTDVLGKNDEVKEDTEVKSEVKSITDESLKALDIEVFEEIQTEPVVPKPVPSRSCLLRQEAVSNTLRHSHLFEDIQHSKNIRPETSSKSGNKETFKSKFGAHKFIAFQPSSVKTLSNEVDDLNYSQDYDPLSRGQEDDSNVKQPRQRGPNYKKNLRRKLKKKCKYRDLDSVELTSHSEDRVNQRAVNSDISTETTKLKTNDLHNVSANVVDSKKHNEVSSCGESDKKLQNNRFKKNEAEAMDNGELGKKCDNVKTIEKYDDDGNGKDDVTKCKESKISIVCNKALGEVETLTESVDNNYNEKVVPSRQLSTGFLFSGKTASIERTSSTESGMSIRGSPIKLLLSETGSCDTILEDVNENMNSGIETVAEPSDDNFGSKNNDKVILGVEDLMDNDPDEFNYSVDKVPNFLMPKSSDITNDACTSDTQSPVSTSHSFVSRIRDAQPGCSQYDTHLRSEIEDLHSFGHNVESNSKSMDEEFANFGNDDNSDDDDCSRASTASFDVLSRCSPFSDMFLSRFEVFNPVSPLPPSPVRELEEEGVGELLEGEHVLEIDEDIESDNKLVIDDTIEAVTDQGKSETMCNNNSNEILNINKCIRKSTKKSSSCKSLVKRSKSGSNDINAEKTFSTSVGDEVKINKTDDTNIGILDSPKMNKIKVEELKLSPLPQMISPLKSLSDKQSKTKIEKVVGIGKYKGRVKEICPEINVKNEILENLVTTRTRSKSSVSEIKCEISAIKLGSRATRKQSSSLLLNSESCENSNIDKQPVRESALVKKILRKRAEGANNKVTPSEDDTVHSHDSEILMNKKSNTKMREKGVSIDSSKKVVLNKAAEKTVTRETHKKEVQETDNDQFDVEHAIENENKDNNEETVARIDDKGDHNVLEELPSGQDNLAFKRKTRVAHKPNAQPLKTQKIQIIEAPPLPQVKPGRKRKSTESNNNNNGQEKKQCKQSSFSKQTNNTCISKAETKRMQTFLKSTESADSFVVTVTEEYGQDHVGNILLLTCFECLGRVKTDPLDVVFENCLTDAHLTIGTELPFLSDVEKRALYLTCYLLEQKYLKKDQLMRSAWDTVLCHNLTVNVIGKMTQCRFFIALCAEQGNLELARTMLDQLVRSKHINFILFIVPVVSVWPEILRKNPADSPDNVITHGFILVLEELITERLLAMNDTLSKKILHILKKLCLWSGVCGNSEMILRTLFVKLQTCTETEQSSSTNSVFELTHAVNLLCASKPWPWVKVNFIERHGLQTGVNRYLAKLITKRPAPRYICALLKMTSHILNIHASTIRERDYQQLIRNWLLPVLKFKSNDDDVTSCCLETMIELTPLYPTCLHHIHSWFQDVRRNVSDELVTRLEDLRSQYKQRFGLVCKPFIKS